MIRDDKRSGVTLGWLIDFAGGSPRSRRKSQHRPREFVGLRHAPDRTVPAVNLIHGIVDNDAVDQPCFPSPRLRSPKSIPSKASCRR